jgi:hypothetical protein
VPKTRVIAFSGAQRRDDMALEIVSTSPDWIGEWGHPLRGTCKEITCRRENICRSKRGCSLRVRITLNPPNPPLLKGGEGGLRTFPTKGEIRGRHRPSIISI